VILEQRFLTSFSGTLNNIESEKPLFYFYIVYLIPFLVSKFNLIARMFFNVVISKHLCSDLIVTANAGIQWRMIKTDDARRTSQTASPLREI